MVAYLRTNSNSTMKGRPSRTSDPTTDGPQSIEHHRPSPPFRLIQKIGPPLHHPRALLPIFGAVIGGVNGIAFLVSKLAFDGIGTPKTALIEDTRGQRPEPVRCRALMIAHTIERVE